MFDPLLAMGLGIGAEGATALVIKGLAVGGGFLVGYFLGAAVAWALDRWVFAHKAPPQVRKVVALLAGVALAVVVAMILFGEGGNGLFGRGGEGNQKGATPDEGKKAPEPPKETPKEKEPPKPKVTPKPTPGDIRVTILGGDEVKPAPQHENKGRFYLLEGESEPKSFPEFQKAIEARRKAEGPPLKAVYYQFKNKNEELPLKHKAIQEPYEWLTSLGIGFVPE